MYTPMGEKSKLDEDKEGKAVDPSHYHGMIGTLLYLTASRPDLQFSICMCARYQARPTEKHLNASCSCLLSKIHAVAPLVDNNFCVMTVSWSSEMKKSACGYPVRKLNIIAIVRFSYAGNNVQHSISKHIDIRFHFIKEHVENGVIELYFVNIEYQLVDIFTKALVPRKN
ncbi:hypothetical protein Tco_0071899 [Tanacetum coccineum]